MAVLDTLQPLIPTSINLTASNAVPTAFGMIIIAEHDHWSERVRSFTGSTSALLLDQLVAAGAPVGSPIYRAAFYVCQQPGRPETLYFGRREPGDANWAAALTAMRAASVDWYAGVAVVRDTAEIAEIMTWQSTQISGWWVVMSASADVLNDVGGNLAETIAALPKLTGTLLYHDPQTASGAAVPTLSTSVGPWSLTPGGVLSAVADGAVVDTSTLAAAPATILGTNTGPFAGADGQVFTGSIEGVPFAVELDATRAVATSAVLNNYDLTAAAGGTIIVETDTGTDTFALFSGAAPGDVGDVSAAELAADFVAAVTGTVATASAAGGYPSYSAITYGTDSRFRFAAGTDTDFLTTLGFVAGVWYSGGGNVADVSAYTAAELGGLIQSDVGSSGGAGNDGLGALQLDGTIAGTASNITIATGTAGLLTAVGISVSSVAGTGDVNNAASVGAIELNTLLDTNFTSGDVTNTLTTSNTVIRFDGALGVGRWHTLRMTGALRSELGLSNGEIRGAGTEDDHADAMWVAQLLGRDLDTPPPIGGIVNADNRALVGAFGDSIPVPKSINMRENMDVSTLEQWTPTRRGPETHDGRCTGRIDGQVVYLETLLARDWLALRLQQAIKAGLDQASDSNQPIPFTTEQVTAAVLAWVTPVFALAAATGILPSADLTPPDPAKGKITGFQVVAIEASTALDRSLRRARIIFVQQLAGSLQRAIIDGSLINA